MRLSVPVIRQIQAVFGREVAVPSDFEALSRDMAKKTGVGLSVNTLKRLFGAIESEVEPHQSTLDILARYMGAKDWPSLLFTLSERGNSEFSSTKTVIWADKMLPGDRISFTYLPNRSVELECIGNKLFHVIRSENSKLRPGDRVYARYFSSGYPFLADLVLRDGVKMGSFVAGEKGGIDALIINDSEKKG